MFGLAALLMLAGPEGDGPARARSLEPMANWFSDRDYPADAIRRQAEGRAGFRLVIDQRGSVESCAITTSSGDEALDSATCSILRIRGRFSPALDAGGHPVKDSIAASVRWALPERHYPTIPFEPIRYVSTLRATADGAVLCSTNDTRYIRGTNLEDCGYFIGSNLTAQLRSARIEASITAIQAYLPEGVPAPAAGAADYGIMLYDAEVVLGIDRQGRISACRAVREIAHVRHPDIVTAPGVCTHFPLLGEPMFEPAPERAELRNVRVVMTIHGRNWPGTESP